MELGLRPGMASAPVAALLRIPGGVTIACAIARAFMADRALVSPQRPGYGAQTLLLLASQRYRMALAS